MLPEGGGHYATNSKAHAYIFHEQPIHLQWTLVTSANDNQGSDRSRVQCILGFQLQLRTSNRHRFRYLRRQPSITPRSNPGNAQYTGINNSSGVLTCKRVQHGLVGSNRPRMAHPEVSRSSTNGVVRIASSSAPEPAGCIRQEQGVSTRR